MINFLILMTKNQPQKVEIASRRVSIQFKSSKLENPSSRCCSSPVSRVLPSVLVNMKVARMDRKVKREAIQQLVKRTNNHQFNIAWQYNPTFYDAGWTTYFLFCFFIQDILFNIFPQVKRVSDAPYFSLNINYLCIYCFSFFYNPVKHI